jgi:hypothetical protein
MAYHAVLVDCKRQTIVFRLNLLVGNGIFYKSSRFL